MHKCRGAFRLKLSVREFGGVTHLAPKISRWLLEFLENVWNRGLESCTGYRVASKFSGRDLLHVTLLAPKVLRFLIDFRKVCETLD